jgi:hypothetical protein
MEPSGLDFNNVPTQEEYWREYWRKRPINKAEEWHALAESGLTDLDVDGLAPALFLFAYQKIQKCSQCALPGIWKHFAPYWERRLPSGAFKIVESEYARRATQTTSQPLPAERKAAQ